MDNVMYYRSEKQLDIREQLLFVEADRLRGIPDIPADVVIAEGRLMLRDSYLNFCSLQKTLEGYGNG
jgi:hypothetical protein